MYVSYNLSICQSRVEIDWFTDSRNSQSAHIHNFNFSTGTDKWKIHTTSKNNPEEASDERTLPLEIFHNKVPFFQNTVILWYFLIKLKKNFLEDSGHFPNISEVHEKWFPSACISVSIIKRIQFQTFLFLSVKLT